MTTTAFPAPASLTLNYTEWRPQQVEGINFLRRQSPKNIKVLEAPTGSGKTGIVLGLSLIHI